MFIFTVVLSSILSLAILVFLVYLLILIRPKKATAISPALITDYAHRGLHSVDVDSIEGKQVPENSLLAFELACKRGFGIELDVQLSKDGCVMVFHDYTLNRMTGVDKKLNELTAEALKSLSLNGTDQHIPTFEEVLKLVGGRVPLLVELKGENFDTALCPAVAALLREYRGEYCLESFNPLLIGEMKKHLPNAFRGLLYTNVCKEKKRYSALNMALTAMALNVVAKPNFIAFNQDYRGAFALKLTNGLYRAPKFVWTVRSVDSLELARKNGECAIFEKIDPDRV